MMDIALWVNIAAIFFILGILAGANWRDARNWQE